MKKGNSISFKGLAILLITLISGLVITGISFIDAKFWEIVFGVAGTIAYIIVGLLIDLGLTLRKREMSELFWVILIILVVFIYKIYCAMRDLKIWITSMALWIKILVIIVFLLSIIGVILIMIFKKKHSKKGELNEKNQLPGD